MIFDHSGTKLEINRRNIIRNPKCLDISRKLVNNTWAKEEITQKVRKYFELNANQNTKYKHLR